MKMRKEHTAMCGCRGSDSWSERKRTHASPADSSELNITTSSCCGLDVGCAACMGASATQNSIPKFGRWRVVVTSATSSCGRKHGVMQHM
jgi:hypothetical protein